MYRLAISSKLLKRMISPVTTLHLKMALAEVVFLKLLIIEGLSNVKYVFEKLGIEASNILPHKHADLGNLAAFDGSLIDAVLSMTWADYRKGSKKAKVHLGFNLRVLLKIRILVRGQGMRKF